MSQRAANLYRRVYVESAAPVRVLDELLRGLAEDLHAAPALIAAGDAAGKGKVLGRALAIIGELRAALDPTPAPEMVFNLTLLYDWMIAQITKASMRMSAKPLLPLEKIVIDLREAFATAARTA